jgi:recombination protein RecR
MKSEFNDFNIYNLDIDKPRDIAAFLSTDSVENINSIINDYKITEIIFGLNNNIQNEILIEFITNNIDSNSIRFTRMATGIPIGGNINYVDIETIKRAIEKREKIQ